jgi:signal peptidase II
MTAVLVIAGAVLALDQITKALLLEWLDPGAVVVVVDGLINLTLVMNAGLAFGLLGGLPRHWRWVVTALSLGALIMLGRMALTALPVGGRLGRMPLGLILGGAVGNLIDRARYGAVVDFIDVHWRGYHWPAFNVADSSISVGVVLLALQLLAGDRRRG